MGMWSLVRFGGVLAFICWAAVPALGARVGVDARDGVSAQSNLASGEDFDTFRQVIADKGHTVVPVSQFNTADLAGLDALILSMPYTPQGFSSSEMSAIQVFVSSGRGLGVLADCGATSNVTNLNALVAPYGITYNSVASDINGYTISAFSPHMVTAGLTSVGVDYQFTMLVTAPATDVTLGSGSNNALAVLGTGPFGPRAVFLSDKSLWNDAGVAGSDRPITFGSNQLLLENVVTYLTPEPMSLALLAMGVAAVVRRRR